MKVLLGLILGLALAGSAVQTAKAAYYGAPNPLAPDAASVYLFDGNANDATAAGRNMVGEEVTLSYTSGLHEQALNARAGYSVPAMLYGLPHYGSNSSVIVNTSNFAVEMAVNVQQNLSQCFLGAHSTPGWNGNNRVFALRSNYDQSDSSRIYFEFAVQAQNGNLLTASSPSVPFSLVQDQWVTIAGRSTGTTLELYVNGVLVNSSESAGANANFLTNQTAIRVGTDWGGGSRAYALIDDVAIYNTARTDFQAIPEPSALALASLTGLGLLRRRRSR